MTYYEIMKKIIGYPVRLGPHPPPRIKKIMLAAIAGIMVGVLASAQQQTNITTTVCPGAGCVDVTTSGQGTLAITISGTWVGTITFSGTVDGTNYTSLGMALITTPGTIVTTTTGNGTWSGSVAGLQKVRIAFTAFTSGTAAISARMQQSANHIGGGSGGGGGSGTVTSIATTAPITGGTITTTGTIACPTCVTPTSASAFTNKTGAISQWTNDSAYLTAITGGTCTNQTVTALSTSGATTCTTLTSAYVTGTTGTGNFVLVTSPTLITPILGTPTSVTLTNGTGLPEGGLSLTDITTNNASASAHGFLPKWPNNTTTWLRGDGTYTAVTAGTNANLTGVITSVGNATSIGAQTGTGTTFVTQTSPTLITPVLGVASGTSLANTSFISSTQSINATSTDGLLLTNTTAAANGAQQWSPRIHLTGQGWKTTATAASQATDWIIENQPVQGTTAPTSLLVFSESINGGAYTKQIQVEPNGILSGDGNSEITMNGFFVNLRSNGGASLSAGTNVAITNGVNVGNNAGYTWAANDVGAFRTSATQIDIGTTKCDTAANCRDLRVRHYIGGGTAPAVTNTSANSCGTTAATLVGTDTAGKVTAGATSATSCTVTFAVAYANAPACAAIDESTAVLTTAKSTTTTVILSGVFTAADVIAYHCIGY